VVETAHAVADFIVANHKIASLWNSKSNIMVSLNVPTHADLHTLALQLKEANIPHTFFYEPDISEHTAICTTDAAAHLLSKLPLALKHDPFRSNGKTTVSKTVDAGSIPAWVANKTNKQDYAIAT
jgi:hypothetical protein